MSRSSDNRMPTLMGKYKVPHFDAKGEADRYFREIGVPTTFLLTSFYWDNMIGFGSGPQKGPDGRYAITFPMADKPLPADCRRRHRALCLRDLQAGTRNSSGAPSASPAST